LRQYGVMRLLPCYVSSSASVQKKIAVVIGQAKSARCFMPSEVGNSLIVVNRSLDTLFITQRINLEWRRNDKPAFADFLGKLAAAVIAVLG